MRCLKCEFYNQPDAPYCLDCGQLDFTDESAFGQEEPVFRLHSIPFVLTLTSMILIITVVMTLQFSPEDLILNAVEALIFGSLGSFALATLYRSGTNIASDINRDRRKEALTDIITLTTIEDEINYQMNSAIQENTELINLFAPVDEDDEADGIEYIETTEADKQLSETVETRIALYEMQLNEVYLIRLKSEFPYYEKNMDNFDEAENAKNTEAVENIIQELEHLREPNEFDKDNSYIDLLLRREELFFKKVESAEKFGEKVRSELGKRRNALQRGAKYLPSPTLLSSGNQEFTDFDIKYILSDYSGAFSELENDYRRLKAADRRSDYLIG